MVHNSKLAVANFFISSYNFIRLSNYHADINIVFLDISFMVIKQILEKRGYEMPVFDFNQEKKDAVKAEKTYELVYSSERVPGCFPSDYAFGQWRGEALTSCFRYVYRSHQGNRICL